MKALVIVAHGSRRQSSNDEVITLSETIAKRLHGDYDIVCAGFLELAEPLIPDAIEQAIEQGATEVKVLPYFLSAGRHVIEDVPAEAQKAIDKYPDRDIQILPYIGGLTGMVDLLCEASR